MKGVLLVVLLWMLSPISVFAVLDPECIRPVPDALYEYKEAYVPIEFDHEPFGMEVTDVVLLAAVLLAATWFSMKKKPAKWMSLLMLGGLLYFGLFRGGCICPVGATTNFFIGLSAPELIGKVVAVLFLLPLVCTFFFGRVFCSSACPLGALQHLLGRKKPVLLPARFNSIMRLLPVPLLLAAIWGALRGGMFIACKLDVYKVVFFTGHAWTDQLFGWLKGAVVEPRILWIGDWLAWSSLVLMLGLGIFVPRPFCRFLCPYGVLLGIMGKLGLRRRHIDLDHCVNCSACAGSCPVQAISSPGEGLRISDFHCIQCGRCDEACMLGGINP